LREALTAYAFLMPALLLIFLFGIFPLGFAFFVSLHDWRRFPGEYLGLDHYVRALDGLAYVAFVWLGLLALGLALRQIMRLMQQDKRAPLALALSAPTALAVAWVTEYIAALLPPVLNIPQRLRGQERVQGLFVTELWATLGQADLVALGQRALLALLLSLAAALLWRRFAPSLQAWGLAAVAWVYRLIGDYLLAISIQEIKLAVIAAREAGQELPIWSQIILISLGAGCFYLAYQAWKAASQAESNRRFGLGLLASIALLGGAYLLIAELPRLLSSADPDVLRGLGITVLFAIGTVPFQLAIGLGLAVLLFQDIRGKSFFRIIYFLPYITPFIATSIVFNLLFSHRPNSPINTLFITLGLPAQKWLLEPKGIFELAAGQTLPDAIAGPGLALVVIMIYTIWTYIG